MNPSKNSCFRTPVEMPDYPFEIGYEQKVLSIGSCFAAGMAEKMRRYRFDVVSNPFGIVYNPLTVLHVLNHLLDAGSFGPGDLIFDGDLWHSPLHHGSFSDVEPQSVLENINKSIQTGHRQLLEADLLIITFGTAGYYELKSTGKAVANCHKMDAGLFERKRINLAASIADFKRVLSRLEQVNPGLNIVLTISPVRYLRDGLIESFRSKSLLNILTHHLVDDFSRCHYFPSYEILVDELRDYRFYARDWAHPSEEALDYIWEQFSMRMITKEARKTMRRIDKLLNSMEHRPIHPDSAAHKVFLKRLNQALDLFERETGITLR